MGDRGECRGRVLKDKGKRIRDENGKDVVVFVIRDRIRRKAVDVGRRRSVLVFVAAAPCGQTAFVDRF